MSPRNTGHGSRAAADPRNAGERLGYPDDPLHTPTNFPPDPSPLALAAVFAVAALVIGLVVAAGMWFGLAR